MPRKRSAAKKHVPPPKQTHETPSETRLTASQEIELYHAELASLKIELRKNLLSTAIPSNRTPEKIERFVEWAKRKGVNDENVQIGSSSLGGLGLFARKSSNENDCLLEIPSSIMMTATDALKIRRLADFYNDPIFNTLETLVLIFYLLYHDNNPNSEWRPYIDILPREYSSIFSIPDDEMKLYEGSELLNEISNVQNILILQYRYFKRLIQNRNYESLFGEFTLKRFLWAYEAVWTRENKIPNFENPTDDRLQIFALIPFWDMANHKQGKAVSDFNLDNNSLVFYSMRDLNLGDEVFNFYGDRSNFELFTTNGFVDLETPFISPIKFPVLIDKDDEISLLRKRLFEKLQEKSLNRLFLPLKSDVVPEKLEIFAAKRIVVMKKPLLEYFLENDASVLENTSMPSTPEMIELEKDADRWLQVRCAVLLRKYPKNEEINNHPHIVRLLQDEKLVLQSYAMELAPKDS